jgi:triosephosphate isomerase
LSAELISSNILLAGQNLHQAERGAFTGEISAEMLINIGCRYCIVGHSERRLLFGEDNALINAKIITALSYGLKPIFCVGETLAESEQGNALDVIARQIKEGLNKIAAGDIKKVVVAYEPVWAIGTGKAATPGQAQEAHLFIRNSLNEIYGKNQAADVSLLYGGSVNAANIAALMKQQEINGVLVGSASLDLDSFLAIINVAGSRASSGLK